MRTLAIVCALACASLNGVAAAQELPRDVFERDRALGRADGVERLALNLTLGRTGAEARMLRWLEQNPSAAAADTASAWLALCAIRFREQRFDDAQAACERGEALQPNSATSMIGLLQIRRQAPATMWDVAGVVLPVVDGRVAFSRGGETIQARVDTGAEVAFISESAARRLGGRALGGEAEIGTTTTPVAGGLVTFDVLQAASGARLLNVTAVVLPDAQMAYAGEELVLDLAVLTSMQRAAFLDHGARLALGTAAPRARGATASIYWDESGVGFAMQFAKGVRAVHFDTGSNTTWLFPAAVGALSEREASTRQPIARVIGGLGGERQERGSLFRGVAVRVAGRPWVFDELQMAEADENGEAARIGLGLLARFGTVTLDFHRMRMAVED